MIWIYGYTKVGFLTDILYIVLHPVQKKNHLYGDVTTASEEMQKLDVMLS